MITRFLLPATTLVLAFGILFVSVFSASQIDYLVSDLSTPLPAGPQKMDKFFVEYKLPSESTLLLAKPIRKLDSLKDNIRLILTFNKIQKSQIMLDNANKRLSVGEMLTREGKISEGIAEFAKAQEYLSRSYNQVNGSDEFRSRFVMREISLASLKHRERLESLIMQIPDEARSPIVLNLDKSKILYNQTKIALELYGEKAPVNPFEIF